MKRFVVKPNKHDLEGLTSESVVPYQWMNWWLYCRGVDDLIKSPEDYSNPYYGIVWAYRFNITADLADEVGASSVWLTEQKKNINKFKKLCKVVI